jgi:hypothetical protein
MGGTSNCVAILRSLLAGASYTIVAQLPKSKDANKSAKIPLFIVEYYRGKRGVGKKNFGKAGNSRFHAG